MQAPPASLFLQHAQLYPAVIVRSRLKVLRYCAKQFNCATPVQQVHIRWGRGWFVPEDFLWEKRFVNCQTQLVREEVTFFFVAHRSPLSSGIPGREPRLLASRRQCQLWAAIAGSDDNWKRPALPAAKKKEKKRGKTGFFFFRKTAP